MTTGKLGAWGLLLRSRLRAPSDKPYVGLAAEAPKGAKAESSQTMSKSQLNILQTVVFANQQHTQRFCVHYEKIWSSLTAD